MDSEVSERPQRLAWQQCAIQPEDAERLSIREDAVAKAEAHAAKLINCLEEHIGDQNTFSRNVIKSILDISIREEHRRFEMLVGVAGATGAGKSSMLNALLGYREIFPSGHQGAATAVPCKVAWNFNNNPGFEFVAQFCFQSKEEVTQTIDILVEAFKSRANPDESSFQSEKEREDNLQQIQTEINKGMEKVRAVWKLEEEDVRDLIDSACSKYISAANLIFDSNPAVGELLKLSMKTVHASTSKELADLTKPYLDSTEATHGKGTNFAAWPLVKEVRLFLRSEALKNGICLVDLPGQGEMEASRAEVAQKYSDKIDVTMIVAPVHRAADERIAQELLGKFHSLQMEMDGRLNKEKFSVILSKTDQIEVDDYTDLYGRDDEVQCLKGAMQIAQQEKKNRPNSRRQIKLQSRAKVLLRHFKKTSHKNIKIQKEEEDSIIDQKPKKEELQEKSVKFNSSFDNKLHAKALLRRTKAWVARAKKANKQADLEIQRLDHQLSHWAICNRNRHVGERIEQSFQRQKKPGNSRVPSVLRNGTLGVTVLGVSSTAFWQLRNPKGARLGFPQESFTGIPKVVQWMHKAILMSREKHLLLILSKYLVVFNKLQAWTKKPKNSNLVMYKAEIEGQLSKSHQNCLKDLESVFDTLCKNIEELDTLHEIDPIKFKFKRESVYIIKTWSSKDPKCPSGQKIFWSTYRAIKHPNGINYNWIVDLATPLLEALGEKWAGFPKESLLRLRNDVEIKTLDAWKSYCQALSDAVGKIDWKLGEQIISILPELTAIGTSLCSQISSLLDAFAKEVNGLHSLIVPSIENALQPVFKEALQFGGPGSHAMRQNFLAERVPLQCERLVPGLCQSIRAAFRKRLGELKKHSVKKTLEAIEEAKTQVSIHAGVLSNNGLSAGKLIESCQEILGMWLESPGKDLDHILKQDVSVPDKVTIEHIMSMQEAHSTLFGDGSMTQTDTEDSDSESGSDMGIDATGSETNQVEEMSLEHDVSIQDLEMELKDLETQRKKQ
ncbi:unnamed protein product [Clonostachys chloroleuca]|uniref:Dynamin N-terminal domain-containing protein n=1 Tax=Clonostachys chloroleuca TaxID=1926264 RepID=A0AA35LRY2_9HYPO|nr:unnamed protein product [Clonostachys chloroleuca]